MADFYVPIIQNNEAKVYKIEVTPQTGELSTWEICGLAKGQGNSGINDLIEKIAACFGDSVKYSIDLREVETGELLDGDNISSSTQSITLGLLAAIAFKRGLGLKQNWQSILVTGDYLKDKNQLLQVEEIEKKASVLPLLPGIEEFGKVVFAYVSGSDLKIDGLSENVKIFSYKNADDFRIFLASIFEPEFDEVQNKFLRNIYTLDKTAKFVENDQFRLAKKESCSTNWNGYFIYGEGESGKSSFAYNLCTFLMSIGKIYAPIWISEEIKNLAKQDKEDKYNGLTARICRTFIPSWSEGDGVGQVRELLNLKSYVLVIDNIEVDNNENLMEILWDTRKSLIMGLPIIITSRYEMIDSSLTKQFALKKIRTGEFSKDECRTIISNKAESRDIQADIPVEKFEKLVEVLADKYPDFPGVISDIAASVDGESIDKLIESVQNGNGKIQEIFAYALRQSFDLLTQNAKNVLFTIIKGAYKNKIDVDEGSEDTEYKFTEKELAENIPEGKENVKASLSLLKNYNFIYSIDEKYYGIKSLKFTTLATADEFECEERSKLLDVSWQLRISIRYNLAFEITKKFFTAYLSPKYWVSKNYEEYLKLLLREAIVNNNDVAILDLLIDECVLYGNVSAKSIIEENAETGKSLLQYSMDWSHSVEVLKYLQKKGGDVLIKDKYESNLICNARADAPDFKAKCDYLILKGLDINNSSLVDTPLTVAVTNFSVDKVEYLIKRGANVNQKMFSGIKPIHFAVMSGSKETVKLLLENGADINACDNYGYQPIHFSWHDFEMFSLLVEKGADITAQTGDGETLLDLVECGPYIDWNVICYSDDRYLCVSGPMFMTTMENEMKVHEYLMKHGVQRNFNPEGFQYNWYEERIHEYSRIMTEEPIFYSAMTKSKEVFLHQFTDDCLFMKDSLGQTILHYAVRNPDIEVARFLIEEKEMDVLSKDNDGTTPLHVAAEFSTNTELLSLLVDNSKETREVFDLLRTETSQSHNVLHKAFLNRENVAITLFRELLDEDSYNTLATQRSKQGYYPLGLSAFANSSPAVHYLLSNDMSMKEAEEAYSDGEITENYGEMQFGRNPFCSVISISFELADDTTEYKNLLDVLSEEKIKGMKDSKLKEVVNEIPRDERIKLIYNAAYMISACYNENPKTIVLWARANGSVKCSEDDENQTLLDDVLKRRPDWSYIESQFKRHHLL